MRKIFISAVFMASAMGLSACGSETVANETAATETLAAAGNWEVVERDSHIKFSATQQGKKFTGEFTEFTAEINFDPANISDASVEAVIDLGSVEAGDSERNSALPGKDWFYVKKFPEATFISNDFREVAAGEYEARGDLTIRDATQAMILPFTLDITGDQAVMTGRVELDRRDFGVGQGTWKTDEWVSLDVTIDVKITATKR